MPKFLKYACYIFLFVFAFFIFLYWSFPYNILKERLITATEAQLGPDYDVRVGSFSPSFFTGATLKQVKIIKHDKDTTKTVWEVQKIKLRVSLGAFIFGRTNVKFLVKNQKSTISGVYKNTDDGFVFNGELSNFNIGDFGIASEGSVMPVSSIDGTIKMNINKKQVIQSAGTVNLSLSDIRIKAGKLSLGEGMDFNIPELVLANGGDVKIELAKGSIHVSEFKFKDSDLKLDMTGDIFMSSVLKNYRMNLKGSFSVTPKLEQAMPFLFMVEKQRGADGTYPFTITGRMGQPSIKIGDFTLPI